MSNPNTSQGFSWNQSVGTLIFVVCCGFTALEMSGFGFGFAPLLTLPLALTIAAIGGAVGGVFICPRPFIAGLVGGVLAGVAGLLAVYLYALPRESVWNAELVIVQGIASLPGVGVGCLIKRMLGA